MNRLRLSWLWGNNDAVPLPASPFRLAAQPATRPCRYEIVGFNKVVK